MFYFNEKHLQSTGMKDFILSGFYPVPQLVSLA